MLGGSSVPDYEKLQVDKFYFQIKYNEFMRKTSGNVKKRFASLIPSLLLNIFLNLLLDSGNVERGFASLDIFILNCILFLSTHLRMKNKKNDVFPV